MLGFINRLKKEVNNLIHSRVKNFSRATKRCSLFVARERVACDVRASLTRAARRGAGSSVEGREDPAVVSVDAVVGDDGLASAAAGNADEGAAGGE